MRTKKKVTKNRKHRGKADLGGGGAAHERHQQWLQKTREKPNLYFSESRTDIQLVCLLTLLALGRPETDCHGVCCPCDDAMVWYLALGLAARDGHICGMGVVSCRITVARGLRRASANRPLCAQCARCGCLGFSRCGASAQPAPAGHCSQDMYGRPPVGKRSYAGATGAGCYRLGFDPPPAHRRY